MKPRVLVVSVTVLKDNVSGVCSFRYSDVSGVSSFWWVRGLADFSSEATDLRSGCACCELLKVVRPELFVPPRGFVVLLTSGVKLQTLMVSVTAHKGSADPKSEQQQRTKLPQHGRGPKRVATTSSSGQLLFPYLTPPTSY